MRRVMLVDDEVNVLNSLQRALRERFRHEQVRLETFTDPERALLRGSEISFDVVVSDFRMPTMSGADFLQTFKCVQPDAVRVILSASTDFSAVMDAVNRAEIFRYIVKPWTTEDLGTVLESAFSRRDEIVEARRLTDESRLARGELTPQELEARRLEAEEPGITKVNWGPDGSVRLD